MQVKGLDRERKGQPSGLFDVRDEIDRRRDQLIAGIEGKLNQKMQSAELFSLAWSLA